MQMDVMATTMGAVQGIHTVTNGPVGEPIFGAAVAISSDAQFVVAHDSVTEYWESAIVSRNEWNAGFQFPGSAGIWQPTQTNGTFDALFGPNFDQCAVFWASSNFLPALPIAPGQSSSIYVGPLCVSTPLTSVQYPYVLFGNGQVLQEDAAPVRSADTFGLRHTGIDNATIETDANGRLKVSNLGSSGCDGVSIDVGESDGWSVEQLPAQFVPGSSIKTTVIGSAGATAGIPILEVCLDAVNSPVGLPFDLTFDFSQINPQEVLIELFAPDGTPIRSFVMPSPARVSLDGSPPGLPFIPCALNQPVCVFPTGGQVNVSDPGTGILSPGVAFIQATAVNPAHPVDFITNVEIRGLDIPELVFVGESIQQFQLFESALDKATLDSLGGRLKVSNLGSSGCDGVSIALPDETENFEMIWLPLEPCLGLPPNCDPLSAFIQMEATGVVGGLPGQPLGNLRVSNNKGAVGLPQVRIDADYSSVGSTTQQLEVYSGGVFVGMVTGHPNGQVATATDWPKGCGKGAVEIGGEQTACFTVCWPQDQTIEIISGPTFVGDELRVLAENPSAPFNSLQTFGVRLAEIHEIEITTILAFGAPPCDADLDGDGQVNALDLAQLLGAWGPDPGQLVDLDGDGLVNASDLAQLLGAWGPCP